jgi:hypothetical protein
MGNWVEMELNIWLLTKKPETGGASMVWFGQRLAGTVAHCGDNRKGLYQWAGIGAGNSSGNFKCKISR